MPTARRRGPGRCRLRPSYRPGPGPSPERESEPPCRPRRGGAGSSVAALLSVCATIVPAAAASCGRTVAGGAATREAAAAARDAGGAVASLPDAAREAAGPWFDGAPGGRPSAAALDDGRSDAGARTLPPRLPVRLGEPGAGDPEGVRDVALVDGRWMAADAAGNAAPWPERSARGAGAERGAWEHVVLAPDATFLARARRDSTSFEIVDRGSGAVQTVELGQYVQVMRAGPGLVAAGAYGTAVLCRADGEPVVRHGHETTVTAVAISGDGRWFASSDIDRVTWVSGVPVRGRPVRIDDAEYARDARFAPGGNRLYLAHYRSTVQAWDPRDGSFVRSLETGLEPVDRVAVSPDGRWLVAAGAEVVVFDTAAGSRRRLAPPLSPDVLAFDPGGGLLATASRYGGMQLWEIATGRALPTAAGHTARVEQVRLSADGTWVLSADRDGNLLRWSVATGEATFLGYGSWFAGAAPSGADGALPALERGGRVVGVERATGEVLWRQADPARAAALCPGGARVLVLREAGRIDVVSAATGERLESFAGPPGGPADAIRCRDADHAVAWRGEMLDRWRRGWRWTVTPVAPAFDARVVPSPDGRWAVLLAGGCARRFDADTEIVSACIPAPSSAGVAALSGDGRTLAVETPRGAAVWDVDSARLLAEPDAAGRRVTALDLSGDGGLLAAGLDDRTILVVPVPPPSTPRPLDPARGGPLDPSTP